MILTSKNDRIRIKKAVIETLTHSLKINLPVNIKYLAKNFSNCRVIKYSKFMKKHNLSYNEMLRHAGTDDAYTDYYSKNDSYIIYYNDLDLNKMKSNRYRWNIAHELGHVRLEHHKKSNKTRLFRNTLSKSEYKQLEDEADYFASYILAPYSALKQFDILSKDELKIHCKISDQAADYRYTYYLKWLRNNSCIELYDFYISTFFYNTINKKHCPHCGYYFIKPKAKFCPICGYDKLVREEADSMFYEDGYKLNEDGKLTCSCITCDNEELYKGTFCQICGSPFINVCTNTSCNRPADGHSRYCSYCASPTTFLKGKLLKPWQDIKKNKDFIPNNSDDDLPF